MGLNFFCAQSGIPCLPVLFILPKKIGGRGHPNQSPSGSPPAGPNDRAVRFHRPGQHRCGLRHGAGASSPLASYQPQANESTRWRAFPHSIPTPTGMFGYVGAHATVPPPPATPPRPRFLAILPRAATLTEITSPRPPGNLPRLPSFESPPPAFQQLTREDAVPGAGPLPRRPPLPARAPGGHGRPHRSFLQPQGDPRAPMRRPGITIPVTLF